MRRAHRFTGVWPWPCGVFTQADGCFRGRYEQIKFMLPTKHGADLLSLGDYIVEVGVDEYERMPSAAFHALGEYEELPPEAWEQVGELDEVREER